MKRLATNARLGGLWLSLCLCLCLCLCLAVALPRTAAAQAPSASEAPLARPLPGSERLPPRAEVFFDVGAQTARISSKIANRQAPIKTTDSGLHVGIGARRGIGPRNDIGVRLEFDEMGSDTILAVRPLDFRHNVSNRLAWTGFFGVARFALGTPAYGWYLGGGLQAKDIAPRWNLGVDLRYGDRLARDNVLPSDPKGGSPDNFHSVYGLSVYLSRRF